MTMLRDIMTRQVVTLGAEATLREAIGILRGENVTGAPVVRSGEVVGVVSVTDILDFEVETSPSPNPSGYYRDLWEDLEVVEERLAVALDEEWDLLSEHVVSEVMTGEVLALPAETSLDQAAGFMSRHAIHRVLVMDGKRLLGIVSASDFVRAVASHRA